jgi:hypothetical protein
MGLIILDNAGCLIIMRIVTLRKEETEGRFSRATACKSNKTTAF